MTLRFAALFAIGCMFVTACGRGPTNAPSALHSDSGVEVPYDSDAIAARTIALIPAAWRGYAQDIVYGHSALDRKLHVIRIATPTKTLAPQTRPAVLITQAIHGNEFLDIANNLPAGLFGAENNGVPRTPFAQFLASGGVLYIVPVVNPDGFAARQRGASDGSDLNRDFPIAHYVDDPEIPTVSKSVENKSFEAFVAKTFAPKLPRDWSVPDAQRAVRQWHKDFVADREDLKLFFDLHCCQAPDSGSLMPPWGDTPSLNNPFGIPAADVTAYKNRGTQFKSVFPEDFYGTGIEAIGYIAKGTGDELVYEGFADLSLTYEGLENGAEPGRLPRHLALWDVLFTALNAQMK